MSGNESIYLVERSSSICFLVTSVIWGICWNFNSDMCTGSRFFVCAWLLNWQSLIWQWDFFSSHFYYSLLQS